MPPNLQGIQVNYVFICAYQYTLRVGNNSNFTTEPWIRIHEVTVRCIKCLGHMINDTLSTVIRQIKEGISQVIIIDHS